MINRSPSWIQLSAALSLFAVVALGCADKIPHPIASESDSYCKTCHAGSGRAGAPGGHKSGCTLCHGSRARGPYPALMPHRGGDPADCKRCHQDGTIGAPLARHLDQTDCYTCHQAPEYGAWPPAVPHQVTSFSDQSCLDCHGDSKHPERPSCQTCHQN
jgi:hypothetical protein